MRVNIFSGGRRIAGAIAILWSIGCIFALVAREPTAYARYWGFIVNGKSVGFQKANDYCSYGNQRHRRTIELSGGEVEIELCYAEDAYPALVEQSAASFSIPDPDKDELSGKVWESRKSIWAECFGALFGGLIFFGVFTWLIGWIVRGFLGVPNGSDFRLESNKSA